MDDIYPSVRTAVFNRYVSVALVLFLGSWLVSTQPFGYWLKPVANLLYSGFWESRLPVQLTLGRSFVGQLVLFYLWFFVYSLILAVVVGNTIRRIVSVDR